MNKKSENLKKLSRTNIIVDFIKKNNGFWNHQSWVDFCKFLEKSGYYPIDFNKVGALIEDKKKAYHSLKLSSPFLFSEPK